MRRHFAPWIESCRDFEPDYSQACRILRITLVTGFQVDLDRFYLRQLASFIDVAI